LWPNAGAAHSRARRFKDAREDTADLSPKHPNTAPETMQTPVPIDRPTARNRVPRDWPVHGAMVESRPPCRGDEIGKHSGLKIRRLTACRFKSGPRHHSWHKGLEELAGVVEKPRCAFSCQRDARHRVRRGQSAAAWAQVVGGPISHPNRIMRFRRSLFKSSVVYFILGIEWHTLALQHFI
jgi:hypothetical protein